jgi:subtilisin family serine protease
MLSFTPGVEFVAGELLIGFRQGAELANIQALYSQFGLNELRELDRDRSDNLPGIKQLKIAQQIDARLISLLERSPWVEYAEPNYVLSAASTTPLDPRFNELWGLHNTGQVGGLTDADVDAPEAWDVTTGSSNVVVFVIDSGVDYSHPDLAANIWTNLLETPGDGIDNDNNGYIDDIHGINSITGSGDPMDDNNHGTHVAGTIGAAADGTGVVGVNWNVKIGAAKFLGANGFGSTADAIECFNYINALKVRGENIIVTNNSWSGGAFSQALMDAMNGPAGMDKILHAAAAGNANNNNDGIITYPAGYNLEHIISVAATDRNDKYASFSSYGANSVDIAAPGVSVLSTIRNNGYAFFNGTSMATPHVAGAAALIAAHDSNRSATQIKQDLMLGADPIGHIGNNWMKPTATEGRLNIHQSLLNIIEDDILPPAPATSPSVTGTTMTTASLTWTATGDDGSSGTAHSYDVRYSTTLITAANWNSATRALGEPRPQAAGASEAFTVKGLQRSTTYHFALKVKDNDGNDSEILNFPSATTEAGTIIFADGFEANLDNWNPQSPWGRTTSIKRTGTYSVTDSPSGNYSNNANTSLTSDPINLTGFSVAQLSFWHRYTLENTFDFGYVEASKDGDTTWTTLASYTGTNTTFHQITFDLANYVGSSNVLIRFRLQSDSIFRFDGWHIDDVLIVGEALPPNTPPVAIPQSIATDEDTSQAITLSGSDAEGSPLTYTVVASPAHGTLSGTVPNLIYTPATNYNGADSFTFRVNDGASDSTVAAVSITVNVVNDAPVADSQLVVVKVGAEKAITLSATDVDGDSLTYTYTDPTNGALSGTAPNLTYTPDSGFAGPEDSFTFHVYDGLENSNTATVTIQVTENRAPVAEPLSVTTAEDTDKPITLTGTDLDGDSLIYEIVASPQNGTLENLNLPNLIYSPNENYNGTDSFSFQVYDGSVYSGTVFVSLAVTAVNDAPMANPQSVSLDEDSSIDITLSGSDVENSPLSYTIVAPPTSGILSGTGTTRTYTPNQNFNGTDIFTFKVSDGAADSPAAAVSITVSPVDEAVKLYFSLSGAATLGGVSVANEDIVAFDGVGFSLFFDGSAAGLPTSATLDAFAVLPGGSILMSLADSANVPGVSGTVDDSDIVQYTPGSGFGWYFDGSDVGLTTNNEDVTGIELLPDGSLLISTTGSFSVTGASGGAQDIIRFTPATGNPLGDNSTTGTWQMYFDGSDVGLSSSSENLSGIAQDESGKIHLVTSGNFSVTNRSGANEDVFFTTSLTPGSSTSAVFSSALFFDGSAFGLGSNSLTGIDLPPLEAGGTGSAAALVLDDNSSAAVIDLPAKNTATLAAREQMFASYGSLSDLLVVLTVRKAGANNNSVAELPAEDEPEQSAFALVIDDVFGNGV